MEGSFVDYYGTPITTARTCKEQYDIDVARAKRNYGFCGAAAVATAGATGGNRRINCCCGLYDYLS